MSERETIIENGDGGAAAIVAGLLVVAFVVVAAFYFFGMTHTTGTTIDVSTPVVPIASAAPEAQ